jgi:very-short-patch-repair endonuclease
VPNTRYLEGDGTIQRARTLRRDGTPAERKLWSFLRGDQLDGFKFRRQQRLGPFFADFVCQAVRLVIEIDGETHAGPAAEQRDAKRTAFLEREGYRVIRFSNADIMGNAEGAVTVIRASLVSAAPSPSRAAAQRGPLPLPQGERK